MLSKLIHLEDQISADYRTIFNAMPGASGLVLPNDPEFTIVASTDEFAAFAGVPKEKFIGSSLFQYFPDNPDAPNVSDDIRKSLAICLSTKKKNQLAAQRYDIAGVDGTFHEMYWTVIHTPIFDENGNIIYIIHTAVDVTDRYLADIRNERIKSLEPMHNLFNQTTVAIHVFKGPDLVVELANNPTLKIWGRDASVIGKPLRDILPELDQQYIDIINSVRLTGIPFHTHDAPVTLHRNGNEETAYFNITLQPYYEDSQTTPVGVLAMVTEVTQIHNSRIALAQKEHSLQMAVEIGDLGVFNIDLETNTIGYSPQIMEWFGLKKLNQPLGMLLGKVHPDDRAMVTQTLTRTVKGKTYKHDIIFRVINPITGEIRYLHSIGQLQIQDETPSVISGIIQDVSGRIRSEVALEQSAQQLKSFIDSAPFPIAIYTGREMRIEMANQAVLDAWGRDNVIGKTYTEALPELEETFFARLQHVYDTGKAFHAHNERVDFEIDGHIQSYYFNYSFTPLFDAEGKVYGVMNTAADVTDLNLAKQGLEQSERNFRNIILQAPVAMCLLVGPEHIIEVANEAMINLWGKTADAVINKAVFEGLPDARNQGLEKVLATVFEKGETFAASEMPVELMRFGKPETVYQNFVYEPYRDGEGIILGILAITTDVTEHVLARQKIEEIVSMRTRELADANEKLKKSNAELEQFAHIASHDLQEPLRKISTFTGLLEHNLGEINERSKQYMDKINNSVYRMTNLIRDILNYSQLSEKSARFTKVNLEKILSETLADLDVQVQQSGGKITHSELPTLKAIPLQMSQLFTNLISNSLKYSRKAIAPEINITCSMLSAEEVMLQNLPKKESGYYRLSFRDNGIGFGQEYAERIFSIFQRLHGKLDYEGTGIGLAICKKIAENHHGQIYATGQPEKGAEFVVILPAEQ
jgi:PAS domain S-box-containing protein